MRAGQIVALVVAAFVGSFVAGVDASECSYCQYAAWNCSLTATDTSESLVQQAGKTDLRKESNAAVTDAVRVCDATGKIQVDDVFCDTNDCECADDKQCVSLVLGCQHIFQARSRKRCIGASAIQQRFNGCAAAQKLTTQAKANLDIDWVQFKNKQRCKSNDCKAVRRFHECGAVQCGYLIVAWKESASEYRFVVDGSRACDMEAGTFLFNASLKSLQSCNVKSIESTKINDCYSLQTRNQQNGTCNGIYLQVDSAYQTSFSQQIDFSKLSQGVWLTVVACIAAAVLSVASVLVIYIRFHRSAPQDELDGLLPDDLTDCKTPESQDSPELQDAATPATNDVRQRVISPKSQSGAGN